MIRFGDLELAVALALITACAPSENGVLDPARCEKPSFLSAALKENPENVLSMLAITHVSSADSIVVHFGSGDVVNSETPAFDVARDSAQGLVLGLLPSTQYNARIVALNGCGTDSTSLMRLTTKSLPSDIPKYTASGSNPDDGFIVIASGVYGLVLDNTGRVVWYHRFPSGPGLNFQAQPNGHYAARPTPPADTQAQWIEISPDGSVTRTIGCANGLQARMHDMIALEDGSHWMLCDETRSLDLSDQGAGTLQVTGTHVQRLGRAGELTFDWSPFDHIDIDLSSLQSGDISGSNLNWTHGNAIDIASDGNLLVSFRNLNEITKIDSHSGAVIWRLGGSRNQFTFSNVSGAPFSRQHGLRAAAGGVLLLDNLGEPTSRAEYYELDEINHVARLGGSFRSSQGVIAQIGGSTQSLPDAHTLVSFGNGSGVEEYDASGNVVWRMEGNPGYVFRAQRIRSLYKPGVGDTR